MGKPRVLFLCTGNSARSQMAEAFLRRYAGDHFDVFSAGLEARGMHPFTLRVMEEVGFDLSGQYSKSVADLWVQFFGYQIAVCSQAQERCPIFPGVNMRLYWPFDDPVAVEGTDEDRLEKFREVRDQIDERIRTWLRDQGLWPDESGALSSTSA